MTIIANNPMIITTMPITMQVLVLLSAFFTLLIAIVTQQENDMQH